MASKHNITAKVFPSRDDYSSGGAQDRFHWLRAKATKQEHRDDRKRSRSVFENTQATKSIHDDRERELENKSRDLQAWNSSFNNEKNEMRQDLEAARAIVSQHQPQLAGGPPEQQQIEESVRV